MKKALKKVYSIIPFKQKIFSLLKKVWMPGEPVYRHLHFTGVIKVPVDNARSFKMKHYGFQIENEVFWSGLTKGWEKESIKLWIELAKHSEVIFDIGANTGIYALTAKAVNLHAHIYAFEPVERVFSKLQENILLNNYDIIPVQKAVSSFDGTAIIYDLPTDHIYSVTVNKNLSSASTEVAEVEIATITLDSFIEQNNINKIDLLKIDVETHEAEVIEGFSNYLPRFRPAILIEILNDEVGRKVENMIQGLDYLYFNINERGSIRQVSGITKSDYYNYLLCDTDTATKLALI